MVHGKRGRGEDIQSRRPTRSAGRPPAPSNRSRARTKTAAGDQERNSGFFFRFFSHTFLRTTSGRIVISHLLVTTPTLAVVSNKQTKKVFLEVSVSYDCLHNGHHNLAQVSSVISLPSPVGQELIPCELMVGKHDKKKSYKANLDRVRFESTRSFVPVIRAGQHFDLRQLCRCLFCVFLAGRE